MNFWNAAFNLPPGPLIFLSVALFIAFLFEFINGFHDTANAVTTVIYTRSLRPTQAVVFSGVMNFLGALINVLFLGAGVAFTIVNLLPVELLVDARSNAALVMVVSLLLAGVLWNLSTWYLGLPVSSSHTLIGSILGVGIANGLWMNAGWVGVKWSAAVKVGLGLLISPLIGFLCAGGLLLLMRLLIKTPRLYHSPQGEDQPPGWISRDVDRNLRRRKLFPRFERWPEGYGITLACFDWFFAGSLCTVGERPRNGSQGA